MTPLQEATELVREYQAILPDHLGALEFPIARQCAILAVSKIIEANPHSYPLGTMPSLSMQKHYQAVLEHLKTI